MKPASFHGIEKVKPASFHGIEKMKPASFHGIGGLFPGMVHYMRRLHIFNIRPLISARRKVYYAENKDKILKDKILWYLNVSQSVEKLSKASIEKYDIKYDKTLKKWV